MHSGHEQNQEADDWLADVVATPGGSGAAREHHRQRVITFGEAFEALRAELERGEQPTVWTPEDKPWGAFEFSPGELHVIGAASQKGKTSLALNVLDRLLERYPDLRVLIASNDMTTKRVIERMVSMRTAIPYRAIRRCDMSRYSLAEIERFRADTATFASRCQILQRPFTIEDVHECVMAFRAQIAFVDHLQMTNLADAIRDNQQRVAELMRALRNLADNDVCVITTAALSRTGIAYAQGRVGKADTNDLDMGVFLHASEIEFVSDNAYLLLAEPGAAVNMDLDADGEPVRMWLHCVKARDSAKTITPLLFDGRIQKFTLREVDAQASKKGTHDPSPSEKSTKNARSEKSGSKKHPKDGGTRWLK